MFQRDESLRLIEYSFAVRGPDPPSILEVSKLYARFRIKIQQSGFFGGLRQVNHPFDFSFYLPDQGFPLSVIDAFNKRDLQLSRHQTQAHLDSAHCVEYRRRVKPDSETLPRQPQFKMGARKSSQYTVINKFSVEVFSSMRRNEYH